MSGRILVVDDDPGVGLFLTRLVGLAGGEAVVAVTAGAALSALRENGFGCIILDKNLPDGRGLDLLRTVRQSYPLIDALVVTADPTPESILEALRLGALDYIAKPFETQIVLNRLRLVIERRRALAENSRIQMNLARGEAFQTLLEALQAGVTPQRLRELVVSWALRLTNAEGAFAMALEGDHLQTVVAMGFAEPLFGSRVSRQASALGSLLDCGGTRFLRPSQGGSLFPNLQVRSGILAPYSIGNTACGLVGVISPRERAFTSQDFRIAHGLAKSLSCGVTLVEARELRQRFTKDVVAAQESERTRIARELHDETGQALTALMMRLRAIEEMAHEPSINEQIAIVRRQLGDAMAGVKRLAQGLRPAQLDGVGFEAAVASYATEYENTHGIRVDLHTNGLRDTEHMPSDIEVTLYRIVQEALTNVVKHSGAHAVSIVVTRGRNRTRLLIEDDGTGFDLTHVERTGTGMGLRGIRERVDLLHGRFLVESSRATGTTVLVEVPF